MDSVVRAPSPARRFWRAVVMVASEATGAGAFLQPAKPREELYDVRKDPEEVHNLAGDPAYADVLKEMRAALQQWRDSVGDTGVTEQFRKTGWSAKYPTRSLEEWKKIESEWENYVLRDAPFPRIPSAPGFASEK